NDARNIQDIFENTTLSPSNERNPLLLCPFQVSNERVFILGKVSRRPQDFAMQETFFDLADEKAKLVSVKSRQPVFLEILYFFDRHGVCDDGGLRHRCQIRIAGSRRRIAYATPALDPL